MPPVKRYVLASPRGFCAGVERAIEIVERLLKRQGAPIYVRHELVHNKRVVEDMQSRGVIFVDEVAQVPAGKTLVYSAHGVSQQVIEQGEQSGCEVYDATCPLVSKVHFEVDRYARRGYDCILIGHAGHPEVEGTMGRFPRGYDGQLYLTSSVEQARTLQVAQPQKVAYVCQTTLSVDDTRQIVAALRQRYPMLAGPRRTDICYATQNRQDAVKQLALEVDRIIVVGSETSSNTNRLVEIAQQCGCEALRVHDPDEIPVPWARDDSVIGITAGASTPETVVNLIVASMVAQHEGAQVATMDGRSEEGMQFQLPPALRD